MPNQADKSFDVPEQLIAVIQKYLKQNYLKSRHKSGGWNEMDVEYFSRGILQLNEGFTSERSKRYSDYFNDPVKRSGYLCYFYIVNLMKVVGVLSRHGTNLKWPQKIKLVDIGSGPLTTVMGFLVFWISEYGLDRSVQIDAEVYERNEKIVDDGIQLIKAFLREMNAEDTIKVRVHKKIGVFGRKTIRKEPADLVMLGNYLNEASDRSDQWNILEMVIRHFVKRHTKILLIEPGAKKSSRDLQWLRDELITQADFQVLGPCIHQHGCPLNQEAKGDWCHFTQSWQAPRMIQDLDYKTKMKKSFLLYSYLFVCQGEKHRVRPKQQFLAISNLMKAKGRLELIGCGEAGRVKFIRSQRDESEENQKFGRIRRGDHFVIKNFKAGDEFYLNKLSSVRKNDEVKLLRK